VAYGRVHRATRWTIVAIAALAAAAPLAGAQTQPSVQVEDVELREPLTPLETTTVPVRANASCEGWGEAGTDQVAVFSLPDAPETYNVSFSPREVPVPAGPGDCQPGERLPIETSLGLQPGREAGRASHEIPTHVHLEERAGNDTVRRYGPYHGNLSFQTGLLADVDVSVGSQATSSGAERTAELAVDVDSRANGGVLVRLEPASNASPVSVDRNAISVDPGESVRETVVLSPTGSDPFAAVRQDVVLRALVLGPDGEGHREVHESSEHTVAVDVAPVQEDPSLLVPVGLWALGLATAVFATWRWQPSPEPRQRPITTTAAAGWMIVGGAAAMVAAMWVERRPGWFGLGLASTLLGGVWMTKGRTPAPLANLAAWAGPDGIGAGLAGLGLAAYALSTVLPGDGLRLAAGLACLAGAWALIYDRSPRPAHGAIVAAPVVYALGPRLAEPIIVGVFGEPFVDVQLGETLAVLVGAALPLLVVAGVLVAREGKGRILAALAFVNTLAVSSFAADRETLAPVSAEAMLVGLVLVPLAIALIGLVYRSRRERGLA